MSHLPFGYAHDEPPRSAPMPPTPIVFEPARPQRWEYRLQVVDPREEAPLDAEQLTQLGADGWILISVVQIPSSASATRLHYYFMRPA